MEIKFDKMRELNKRPLNQCFIYVVMWRLNYGIQHL